VFISDTTYYKLLEVEGLDSPFFKDCGPTFIGGLLVFPYMKKTITPDKTSRGKAELSKTDALSIEWDKLTLKQGNYPLLVEISMELMTLSDDMFGSYIIKLLKAQLDLIIGDEILYGSGINNRIEGVCLGAKTGTYTDIHKAIQIAFLELDRLARKGAKLYISRSLALSITFEKDTTGQFIYPIYNSGGIKSIAQVPVEVDEGLVDDSFLFGNATNYLINFTKTTQLLGDIDIKHRTLIYAVHIMLAGKAIPNSFYYGTKATVPIG